MVRRTGFNKQPPPTERAVQRSILTMAGRCFPDVLIHHSPNGAHLAGEDNSRFRQMGALKGDGLKVGFPDLICLWNGGGVLIEVKREGGKLSDEQEAMHARLKALGWPVAVCRSDLDAWETLTACGAPCAGRLAA